MDELRELASVEEWEDLRRLIWEAGEGKWVIFKASPLCPVSRGAERVFRDFVSGLVGETVRAFLVDVVNRRDVSRKIAEDCGVRHESPQVIFLEPGGRVSWSASHLAITREGLEEAAFGNGE